MPLAALSSAQSRIAAAQAAGGAATAAWSRNAHRAATGNCWRRADQSIPHKLSKGGGPVTIEKARIGVPVLTFQEPPRTGFEITWSLFGIRFRVLPSFFLISALLAYLFIRP